MYCIIPCPSIMTKERSYNPLYGLCVDIPHVWCGCLAHVVRMVCTTWLIIEPESKSFLVLLLRGEYGVFPFSVCVLYRETYLITPNLGSPLFSSSVKATRKVSKHLKRKNLFCVVASYSNPDLFTLFCLHKISSFLFFFVILSENDYLCSEYV